MSVPLDKLLDTAKRATKRAGQLLATEYDAIHNNGKSFETSQKTAPNDPVTEVDRKAQEVIIEEIQLDFPNHRFIAEEEGADTLGDPDSPYAWIIDPLDGTLNFIHGRQNFGSIVAVQRSDEIIAGAMIIPLLDQFFYGAKGQGAFYNETPIKLRNTKSMSDAVLCSNIVRRAKEDKNGVLQVSSPHCASLENYGSAVEEIGEVLRGYNDGTFFNGIRIWDIAAGYLLIEEAGGRMKYEFKEPGNYRSGLICAASTAPIFDELWEWLTNYM